MANVFPGYRGIADIGSIGLCRFGDASITASQEINAPDLIMGDWDHDAYVYGPITVGGSISGPVTETFTGGIQTSIGQVITGDDGLWHWGVTRYGTCGTLTANDISLYYYCGTDDSSKNYRAFTGMLVNSLNFSCSAGDIAQFSLDVVGTGANDFEDREPPPFKEAEKLITWDKVSVSISPPGGGDLTWEDANSPNINFSNFDFTIANNIETVYSLAQSNLFPFALVPGLRTITGSLSVYNIPQSNGVVSWDDYIAEHVHTVTFNIGALSVDMKVRFHRVEPASSVSNIVSTVGFTGVTHQDGPIWEQ